MRNYHAVLDFDFETEESVLEYGASCDGSAGVLRTSDDREVYERMRILNHDGYTIVVEGHALPDLDRAS